MRPPLVAAIVSNCLTIQSRAPKMPEVAVEVVSEKSLRVPNETSVTSVDRSRSAEMPASIETMSGMARIFASIVG